MSDSPPGTRRVAGDRTGRSLTLEGGQLVVVEGPDRGRRFTVGRAALAVGSAPDNQVVLTDDAVSKHHIVIEETDDGFLLRDLKSTNGTTIDGTRVREGYLASGALIGLGSTRLRFEPPSAPVHVPPLAGGAFGSLLGRSLKMREVFGVLERVAPVDATLLITGETGTGKEVVAQSVHEHSKRASAPFVVVDASATPRDLFESILFGHKEGAFTGAVKARKGAFATADGGTIFIDEIGELPLDLQPKLLRVLEQREVMALGADRPQKVDVRVLAATHRDLRAMVARGEFRQDLYYRLSVIDVRLPPLRERREDIPLIVRSLLERAGRGEVGVAPGAAAALAAHRWEGNVRELKNVVERALVFCGAGPIGPEHLALAESATRDRPGETGERSLDQIEAEAIRATLARTGGNRTQAAKILGISRRSLIDRIARHKIDAPDDGS